MPDLKVRRGLTGWWSSRSDPQRFDAYTRTSLYVLLLMEPILVLGAVSGLPDLSGQTVTLVLVGSMAHVVAAMVVLGPTVTAASTDAAVPVRSLGAFGLLSAALTVAGFWAAAPMEQENQTAFLALATPLIAFVVMLGLLSRPRIIAVLAIVTGAGVAGIAALFGADGDALLGFAISLTAMTWGFGLAFWSSVWMLDVVWRLDNARITASQLAVAEERLRFSRDLHDVMGRNLSVIAVRSQLAEQLALRGRDGAADAMGEVRTIAEQSLREVREVVRGYRSTDLTVELAGARSVLRAASVDCRISGDAAGLSRQAQTVLGWVVREGVTNVIRHSRAQRCDIGLRRTHDSAVLRIENDGVLDTAILDRGSGLSGLAERLRSAGGRLTVDREDDCFRLIAIVPLEPVGVDADEECGPGGPASQGAVT